MTTFNLSIAERVAQLFIVGSDSPEMLDELEPFQRTGLGGLIFFRHHFQRFSTAFDIKDWLSQLSQSFTAGAGLSFLSVDQEGGQVERLPHWTFPSGINPVVFGLKQDEAFLTKVQTDMARRLKWLGFNLNFTPTADLAREMMNPIIGLRAYGSAPQTVAQWTNLVLKIYLQENVMPVLKHFPGHGSGTIDSHLALPVFEQWRADELLPFESGIHQVGAPGVMVAHGLYPSLSRKLGADKALPASLSPSIIQTLLRKQLGFEGLVFSDDLMMNAVYDYAEPEEVAMRALMAGCDMLIYRRAEPEARQAFEYLVHQVQHGKFPESLLDEKVSRILAARQRVSEPLSPLLTQEIETSASPEECAALSNHWAETALHELHHDFVSPLPFTRQTQWLLLAPDPTEMVHYAPDTAHGKDLRAWFEYYGVSPVEAILYVPQNASHDFVYPNTPIDHVVFVAFNSHLYPQQQALYEHTRQQYPQAKMILVSIGMPTDREVLSRAWVHLQLPSYRPAAMQALAQWLISSPRASV